MTSDPRRIYVSAMRLLVGIGVFAAVDSRSQEANQSVELVARSAELAQMWPELQPTEKRVILTTFVERIDLRGETLDIRIRPGRLPSILAGELDTQGWKRPEEDSERVITLTVHAQLKRTGKETRLLIDGANGGARRFDQTGAVHGGNDETSHFVRRFGQFHFRPCWHCFVWEHHTSRDCPASEYPGSQTMSVQSSVFVVPPRSA